MPSDQTTPFDITDGRNRYKPCPGCGAEFGMAITHRDGKAFVVCTSCWQEGPHTIQFGPWHEVDRRAFDGWNAMERSHAA